MEQTGETGETGMWIRDAAAGLGLVFFMLASFALASGAHALIHIG
jgi:hypothetical protein